MNELRTNIETKINSLSKAINEKVMSYDEEKNTIDLLNAYVTLYERIDKDDNEKQAS
nr:MAG TPA: hypothetical protein [Caudoviricetes sp.]